MDTPLDIAQSAVERALKQGASAADAIAVTATDMYSAWRLGNAEELERAENAALGLRVFVGNKTACVSSSDMRAETIDEAVNRAMAMAGNSPDDPYMSIAAEKQLARTLPSLELCDETNPDINWLEEHAAACEDAARAVPGITNSEGADASFSRSHVALATSNNFAQEYASTHYSLSVSVLAGEGEKMERDYDYSVAHFAEDIKSPEEIGKKAAQNTLRRLNPRKMNSAQMPVIFDPRVGKSLLGNFAAAISGSAVARGTSFLKEKMGEHIFSDKVTIIDDPHMVRGIGSKPFDGEGVMNNKRCFVEAGILQSWMLDLRSASQLGLQTTGHAARSVGGNPHPSSTNLYIQKGSVSAEDLIADVKEGLYVTETFGMGINLVTGDYSQGAAGIYIENGKLAYPVSELTIAGHLHDMFMGMTPANDLTFSHATNTPTLHIAQMTVAGS